MTLAGVTTMRGAPHADVVPVCLRRIRPIVHRHLANALSSAGDAAAAAPSGEAADGSEAADGAPAADAVPAGASATSSAAAEAPEQPSPEQRKEDGATPEAAAGAPPGVAS
jgi:hypothetical protein